jgi:tRNA threonylcarbamoyl adenosine modification protein YjeE
VTVPISISRDLPEEGATLALAASLARLLRPGDVLALAGPLGSGKTTIVRAITQSFGADGALVASPTYVMVNLYPIPATQKAGELAGGQIIHVDAYRLSGSSDLDSLGWDRLFDPRTRRPIGNSVALIEWPERLPDALPPRGEYALVRLNHTARNRRTAEITLPQSWQSRPGVDRFLAYAPTRCPTTRQWVEPLSPTWPFVDERARLVDLYAWIAGRYVR